MVWLHLVISDIRVEASVEVALFVELRFSAVVFRSDEMPELREDGDLQNVARFAITAQLRQRSYDVTQKTRVGLVRLNRAGQIVEECYHFAEIKFTDDTEAGFVLQDSFDDIGGHRFRKMGPDLTNGGASLDDIPLQ